MYPNLADHSCFTTPERLGIDDLDFGVESRLSATDERACVALFRLGFDNARPFERIGADGAGDAGAAAAHFQSRFREPVCRIERSPTKAALAKRIRKAPQCLKAHRLRAVISHPPAAQI